MVFYRRYGRKRYLRRNKALSTSRIFGKTGAKSQAKQIYALRKNISRLNRITSTNIKTFTGAASAFTFDNQAGTGVFKSYGGPNIYAGDGDNQRIGNYLSPMGLTWYFTFEYYSTLNNIQSPQPDSEGAMIRILILQSKTPISPATTLHPNDVIANYSATGANYTHNTISPLKPNLTENYKVLKDVKTTITAYNNQKQFKLKVKPDAYRFTDDGNFNNVMCLIVISGLHWDPSINFYQYVKGTFSSKLVWRDRKA